MAKLITVNNKYAQQAFYELFSLRTAVNMVADGNNSRLELPKREMFDPVISIYFRDHLDRIIYPEAFKMLLKDGKISVDQACIIGTSLAFGAGKIYFNGVLTFEIETSKGEDVIRLDNPHRMDDTELYAKQTFAIATVQQLLANNFGIWFNDRLELNEESPEICNDLMCELFMTLTPDYDAWVQRLYKAMYYGTDRYKEAPLSALIKMILMMEKYQVSIFKGQMYVAGEVFDISPYFN